MKRPYFYYDDIDTPGPEQDFLARPELLPFKNMPDRLTEANRRLQIDAVNCGRMLLSAFRFLEHVFDVPTPPIFTVCPHSAYRVFPRIDYDTAVRCSAAARHDGGSTVVHLPGQGNIVPASALGDFMPELIVIGGGEHSRVVIEAVRSHPEPWRIIGFVDPLPCRETVDRMQVERLGGNDAVAKFPDAGLVLGLGLSGRDGQRRQLVERLAAPDARWATVIHHAAWISPTADIGAGTVVLAGAVVNCGAKIGRHCIVNSRACIEHDATLGDFVHAAPGSIVAGGAAVGADSSSA